MNAPTDTFVQRRPADRVTPAYEDAGLFKTPLVMVDVNLTPDVYRNHRHDVIVRSKGTGGRMFEVVFAGRRCVAAAALLTRLEAMTPDGIRSLMKDWTSKYGIVEWRVEKNAFQSMLTQDREVLEFLAGQGSVLREHFTGSNKHDVDFGVASMTVLFQGWQDKNTLIDLPSTHVSEGTKALVEQLVTWHPAAPKTQKTDCVMALWFAELACRDRVTLASNYTRSHVKNSFLTPWDRQQQQTVSLLEAEASGAWTPIGA